MKKTPLAALLALAAALVLLAACGGAKKSNPNWIHEDDVRLAVDETFQPIVQNMVETFGMQHPEATMLPTYVSEDSAIRMLVRDSVRLIIATRPLTDDERKVVEAHSLGVKTSLIATDAIALVVNKSVADTLITLDEVKGIVTGRITRWEQLGKHVQTGELSLVFDHSGSSTVRYMRDSLCGGRPLAGNVYASDSGTNRSVLQMVERNPHIIGVVGCNWLKGDADGVLNNFSNLPVTVMRVARSTESIHPYVRPYQYYIATADYPLLRSVYIINTDPRSSSMLRNFYFFVKGQKGQTIICNNSQLLPITPVQVKSVSVK